MALQGDGNGIVTIPTATAAGDFIIEFSDIEIVSGTEIVIGVDANSSNFVANFAPSDIGTRINGFQ